METVYHDAQRRDEIGSTREGVLRFDQLSDAVRYLRGHLHRTRFIGTLRQVLAEHHHLLVSRMSDEDVINEVSRHLLVGSLQILETYTPREEAASITTGTETSSGTTTAESETQFYESETGSTDSGSGATASESRSTASQSETTKYEHIPPEPFVEKSDEPVEPEPVLTAQIRAEEPPGIDIGAEIQPPQEMSTTAGLESPPAPSVGAGINPSVQPETTVGIGGTQQPAVQAEVALLTAPESIATVDEKRAPSVESTPATPVGVTAATKVDKPLNLSSEATTEVQPGSGEEPTPPNISNDKT